MHAMCSLQSSVCFDRNLSCGEQTASNGWPLLCVMLNGLRVPTTTLIFLEDFPMFCTFFCIRSVPALREQT